MPDRATRHRTNSLGVVTAVALAAMLALGFGMLRRGSPADGDRASSGAPISAGGSPAVNRGDDGRSPEVLDFSVQDGAGATSPPSGLHKALPSSALDRNIEYVVEDGVIAPQRMVGPGMASGGAGTEPSVPEASPMDVPAAGAEAVTVPEGIVRPVVDVPDQQVPGGQDEATRTPASVPADTGEASALQVPGH